MTINDLNMTEEQIVNEIQFMRMFDKYLQKMLGMEKYNELCLGFARMMTSAELKSLGATDEEIDECCDHADMLMWLDELRADRKAENSSEKPNNCEHITEDGVTCAKYPACDDCIDNPLNKVKGSERLVKGSEVTTDCRQLERSE